MAVNHVPFKVLEINVSSAQDLPPVSKMLRTFTVAWIHPDQKLSTRIDYQGHTNPTWNYKLVFRVDDKFLSNETAVVTFEIYNVAWLRDLPIGTAYLFINHISPPLVQNSPVLRPVALHIRRPTGHLQGILHVGISLVSNDISSSPTRSELSAFVIENQDMTVVQQHEYDHNQSLEKQRSRKDDVECRRDEGEDEKTGNSILQKQPSSSIHRYVMPKDDGFSIMKRNQSKTMVKTKSFASSNPSVVTIMHPLPSEVAFHLKKGFYAPEGDEYGSSIFENWSEPSDGLRSKSGKWRIMDDQIPLRIENGDNIEAKVEEGQKSSLPKRRRHSSRGGLFSCFGKGFEFTFAYGSKTAKNNRQQIHLHEKLHVSPHGGNFHRFHK